MSGNLPRWNRNQTPDNWSQNSDPGLNGNKPLWTSSNHIPTRDNLSQCSDSYSDATADDHVRSEACQRLHSLFKDQLFTDVKFIINCGVKPKPTLEAHKAILAVGSNKFKEMLYDGLSTNGTDEFQINNIPFEAFRNVVEYLYTDDVFFENEKSVCDTLSAASLFQVDSLVEKCESHISSIELTEDNVCSKLQIAINNKMATLKSRCIEFIQEYTGSVLRSSDFLSINPTTVKTICKLEKFNLRSEVDLLNAVVRYVEGRPEFKANRRTAIEPYLKHMRLMNLTCDEFNQFVQKYPKIFSAPETATILVSLANPANPSPSLPAWCKRGNNRCNYHLLAKKSQPQQRRRSGNVVRKVPFLLKPCKAWQQLSDLTCVLEMKCLHGHHQIEGIKFSFDDPVHDKSVIGSLIVTIYTEFPRFHFQEHLQIQQSKDVELKFSKTLFLHRGKEVTIRAFAKDVRNYTFLQFDENNSIMQDSPFACSLGSVPKENRLFFISEVLYRDAPPPRKAYSRSRANVHKSK